MWPTQFEKLGGPFLFYDMKIHIYTPTWNEEKILPYFLRHYEQFAERIFIFDGGSDREKRKVKKQPRSYEKHKYDNEEGGDPKPFCDEKVGNQCS